MKYYEGPCNQGQWVKHGGGLDFDHLYYPTWYVWVCKQPTHRIKCWRGWNTLCQPTTPKPQ